MCESRNKKDGRQKIFLVGIGMGTAEGLTGQANEAVGRCQRLIGARRMLQTVREMLGEDLPCREPGTDLDSENSGGRNSKVFFEAHLAEDIFSYIQAHRAWRCIGVGFSGGPGIYRGRK